MKKVLFVATITGHICKFHIPYLKWFKEQGYEVHVASNGISKIEYCDKHFNLPFARFPINKDNIKAYKELKKIINENEYEIIHCHTPVGGVLTRLAAKKSRRNGTKVIYTAHGFHFFKGAPKKNWLIYYPIEKAMARYTDCLITINDEDYEFAKKHLKAKRIEHVHGVGVDEEKFNAEMNEQEKETLRDSLNISKDDFVIIFPAELSVRKNQGMLLRTVKLLKTDGIDNIKVLLPGIDSMNGIYQQMTKELNIEDSIKFLGNRQDIPKLMKISDLAVSTAKQEGLPVNLLEAMFTGLPIIATNCRGNRDIANVLVEIDDINSLCNEIKKCIKNKDDYICKEYEKYKLENVLKEMQKIYVSE